MRKYDLLIKEFMEDGETLNFSGAVNKKVAGSEKALQQFINIFLTVSGSKYNNEDEGTGFVRTLNTGFISNETYLRTIFKISVMEARRQLNFIELSEYKDEQIVAVKLRDVIVDSTNYVTFIADVSTSSGTWESIKLPLGV